MRVFANTYAMISIDGNIWRAVFGAALALIAFTLTRYWTSLRAQTRRVRLLLVTLRGLSLVLIACAFVGLQVESATNAPSRVLLYRYAKHSGDAAADSFHQSGADSKIARDAVNALAEKNIESVEINAARSAIGNNAAFSAGVLLTDAAITAEEARRAMEKVNAMIGGAPVYVLYDAYPRAMESRVALSSVVPLSSNLARGVPVTVRCIVHGRGMSGRESLLTITDDSQAVRASAKLLWANNDEWQTAALEVVPKVAGWTNYAAHIEAAHGEDTATLARSFSLYATERRVNVLFFEGEPTWEAKFIRRALTESGLFDVDYFAQVSRAAVVGIAKDRKSSNASGVDEAAQENNEGAGKATAVTDAPETKLHETLASAARLNSYDSIIVGATPNALLSVGEAARLRDWVERRGGGLIVLGGNNFAGSIAAPNGKLYTMLPAEIDARGLVSELQTRAVGVPVEAAEERGGSVALTPTQAGAGGALGGYRRAREAVVATRESGATNQAMLSGEGFKLSNLRAGATLLATSGMANVNGTSEAGAPLIVATRSGAGRTLVFAPADSWRIRATASGEQNDTGGAFGALWQGVVLWSATGARAPVELFLSDDSPPAGSEVVAELKARDALFNALKIERVNARLENIIEGGEGNSASATEDAREIAFAPDEQDASLWRARFIAPASGRFSLEVSYTTVGGKSGEASKFFTTVAPVALEAGAARDTLKRLSREMNGEEFESTQARGLAAKLAALPRRTAVSRSVWELRSWWPLAIIVSLLLACEWFARRWWQVD
jgi:hypothetical protein